jgi:primosomal protein N' (replication factor Y)
VALADSDVAVDDLSEPRKKILEVLQTRGEISLKQLKDIVPTAATLVRAMAKDGTVRVRSKRVYRDPFGATIAPDVEPDLTGEQQQVVASVCDTFEHGFTCFILKGVTGSGKTEVYMRVAAEAIARGQSALVLVPEIALITQMERRFRARFGERIAILHSGISAGERFDQWSRILNREAVIAIGARSALFAPLTDIGVVIVDEEHDTSYKQENGLRYNARDLAVVRAKLNGCVALLGSATPSIQSYYNAVNGKFREVSLTKRVENRPMPQIRVVDLRLTRDARGFERFITSELRQAMQETLDHGDQVLLFLNRRGYASFPICGACGEPFRCKYCDISLTLHHKANAYRCHYCGFSRAAVSICGKCGSDKIKRLGLGTEKVEETVQALFPQARVARMDRDTTRRKGAILKILKGLQDKTIDILVGTQMVAKGHDFPNITLVGIICADLSLSFPDFRSGERTFQLLAQVSGRAGRGDTPGRVILQTYNPDHFSILAAQAQDVDMFYKQEIIFRKSLKYPPFSRIIQLKISGRDKQRTESHAILLGDLCRSLKAAHQSDFEDIVIMGPLEASLARIAALYRWQIILKGLNAGKLHNFVGSLLAENGASFTGRSVKVVIDVDPYFMM